MSEHVILQAKSGRFLRVKSGFSWLAFVFGPLWAFAKGEWVLGLLLGLAYFGLQGVIALVELNASGAADVLSPVVHFGCMLFWGAGANGWLVSSLKKQGYQHVQTETV